MPTARHAPLSKLTLLALAEALEACFDASAWARLGEQLALPQLADPEMGFQRMGAGDDDYGYLVAQFVSFLERDDPQALRALAARPILSTWLADHAPAAAAELQPGLGRVPAPSAAPAAGGTPHATAEATALRSVHALEAAATLDQAHAFLHALLHQACADAQLPAPAQASTASLFNLLRQGHPALAPVGQDDPRLEVVLGSLAVVVAAISAPPNCAIDPGQGTHDAPEATLMTGLLGTLTTYLQARLGTLQPD